MLSIYPRNQSSCPAVAGAFFYVNLHLAQASAHTGDEGIYSVFKARFFRPFVSRQGSEKYSPYHIGSMLYGKPPVSRRERAVFLLISLTMRSPLTNTDENAGICSESVELTQGFTKSFQVWEMVGGKWLRGGWGAGDGFAEKKRWHQNERDWTRDGRYAILLL